MDQFYITLPSNTMSDMKNTPSKFTVHLPQKLKLQGEWECGLCQIIYPHNWDTLASIQSELRISDVNDKIETLKIPPGCYDSIQDLVETIDSCIKDCENSNIAEGLIIGYRTAIKRACVKIKEQYVTKIRMSEDLKEKLGFIDKILGSSACAQREPNLASFDAMYIHANILEPQIVGDISAPLLRIVNIEGKYQNVIDKTFDYPHYIPVLVKDITDVNINIQDDKNEFIPVFSGKVIIKLHFRKIKHSYF